MEDLTPLKGMPLASLNLSGHNNRREQDLTPLEGMNLKVLKFNAEYKTRGIEVLRAMKSLVSINGQPPAEFWKSYDGKVKK